jgi:hypothetical protein
VSTAATCGHDHLERTLRPTDRSPLFPIPRILFSRWPGAVKAARSAPAGLGLDGEDRREIVVCGERGRAGCAFLTARGALEQSVRRIKGRRPHTLPRGSYSACDYIIPRSRKWAGLAVRSSETRAHFGERRIM